VRHEISRIEPWSAVRIGFFMGLLCGFVLGLLEVAVFKSLSGAGGAGLLPPEASDLANMSGGMILVMAVVTGLLMSLVMSLLGGLTALFYNMVARLFGGLELHLSAQESATAQGDGSSAEDESDA